MAQSVTVSSNTERAISVDGKTLRISPYVGSSLSCAKAEFEARLNTIDSSIASAVANGKARITDFTLYTSKALQGNCNQEIFEAKDQKDVGVCNINNRKLEASQYMLITAVQVLKGNFADKTVNSDNLKQLEFGKISADMANGEFELKLDNKVLIPRSSMQNFYTDGPDSKHLEGYYRLECPVMITPQTDIIPQIWLPANTDASKIAVKVLLHGARIVG